MAGLVRPDGAMSSSSPSSSSSSCVVAMGIVSAPEHVERRAASRATWFRWPNVGVDGSKPISAHFVVRTGAAPPPIAQLVAAEQRAHGDVVPLADVPWNETRLRGPVLSVAAWFSFAARRLPSCAYVAKLDDDAYVHAPALEKLLRQTLVTAPHPERIYMGAFSWFHWMPRIFERSGFGWSYSMAWMLGRGCRNITSSEERCKWRGCGTCTGPFPFASGYLAILSTPLAAEVFATAPSAAPVLADDLARLRAATTLTTRTGGEQFKVMEDIWIGSLLYRQPPSRPVSYVALSEKDDHTLVSDGWGLKVAESALLVHSKNHQRGVQTERFVAIDQFMRSSFCPLALQVRCDDGCRAFLTRNEAESAKKSETFREIWGARIDEAPFCVSAQNGSAFCRVGSKGGLKAKPKLGSSGGGSGGIVCARKPHDLIKQRDMAVVERAMGILNETAYLRDLADAAMARADPGGGAGASGRARTRGGRRKSK